MTADEHRKTHADQERNVLDYWDEYKVFEKSVEDRPEGKPYVFYDGPPFATGLPHYGHIVASVMKDVVPRFWTMKGFRVERKWGWDCHGLPIENIVEKKFNLGSRDAIEEFGIDKFNNACHSEVMKYAEEWKHVVRRLGRWVDMENDYKTMDIDFMESVWWVFKSLWDKGLIYEGSKAMHVCPRCETVLSNFEVAQGYQDVEDTSVIWKFKVKEQENTYLLAWTTTPWSTISTMGLSIGSEFTYVKARAGDEVVICAKDRLDFVMQGIEKYEILEEVKGKELVGLEYEPILDIFRELPEVKNNQHVYHVFAGDYVDVEEGTGIVTINGSYGEIDMEVAKKNGLPVVMDVDMNGKYNALVPAYQDTLVTEAQEQFIKDSRERGLVWRREPYTHSYPHCWRCDTPLLNYATSSWFVRVTDLKDRLITTNKEIHWVPENIKEGRFGKGLEGAPDWAVSRSRYWGAPLPIWRSEDGDVICIGSKGELEELSGKKIKDLHKHIVDKIEIEKDGKKYRRIPEVLDCWFEAGSMPYAQIHYPFENKQVFDGGFPAEFIAEGQDQTRGWFYTLHVLSNALFDIPAYNNVIVNGTVLAEDGKKMSKRLRNYPDPMEVMEKYGADAVRYYLMSSPVVRAENLRFSEKEVIEVSKRFIRILRNVLAFYELYREHGDERKPSGKHVLDKWILARLNETLVEETTAMEAYDLQGAARPLQQLVTDLSTWYVRRSRGRFKALASPHPSITGGESSGSPPDMGEREGAIEDALEALATLREVLDTFSKMLAPFMPMLAEVVYQSVQGGFIGSKERLSVHLEEWPEARKVDQKVLDQMGNARALVSRALEVREEAGRPIKQPLSMGVFHLPGGVMAAGIRDTIRMEVNLKDIEIKKGDLAAELDLELTPVLIREGMARDVTRRVNQLRKDAGLTIEDRIELRIWSPSDEVREMFVEHEDAVREGTLALSITFEKADDTKHQKEFRVAEQDVWVGF